MVYIALHGLVLYVSTMDSIASCASVLCHYVVGCVVLHCVALHCIAVYRTEFNRIITIAVCCFIVHSCSEVCSNVIKW